MSPSEKSEFLEFFSGGFSPVFSTSEVLSQPLTTNSKVTAHLSKYRSQNLTPCDFTLKAFP